MSYLVYVKERGVWAAVFTWLLFSIETFALTIGGGMWLMVYIAVSLAGAYWVITYTEYRHHKSYMEEMHKTAEGLEEKYLLAEMMPRSRRQEERLLEEVVKSTEKSMYEHVIKYKREEQEYKEYIEMWIHEVKVPIASVKMMIANHGQHMPAGFLQEVDKIEEYTEQALYYARSNDVEKDYFIKELTLKEAVEEAVLQNKRRLLNNHVVLQLHDLDKKIYSDEKWLVFLLNQIIGNSIKYAGWEPLILKLYAEEMQSKVLLHIVDNGVGIPDAEIERVCEKGFTGSNGRKFQKSTGIGLYLCKKLCARLGHGLAISAQEGRGCHVTLLFPTSEYSSLTKM